MGVFMTWLMWRSKDNSVGLLLSLSLRCEFQGFHSGHQTYMISTCYLQKHLTHPDILYLIVLRIEFRFPLKKKVTGGDNCVCLFCGLFTWFALSVVCFAVS